jgi:hypothetical protein
VSKPSRRHPHGADAVVIRAQLAVSNGLRMPRFRKPCSIKTDQLVTAKRRELSLEFSPRTHLGLLIRHEEADCFALTISILALSTMTA